MSAYVDIDEVKTILGISDDNLDDGFEAHIETASDDVRDTCGQAFDSTGETEERDFLSYSSQSVRIGPVISIVTVSLDTALDGTFATELAETDYVLEPFNAEAVGIPWKWLTLRATSSVFFPNVRPNVRVEGVFGWEAVPAKVKTATAILANRYLKRAKDAPFAMIPGESVASRIARTDPDVFNLLRKFMPGAHQG